MKVLLWCLPIAIALVASPAHAVITATTTHAHNAGIGSVVTPIFSNDLLQESGVIASETNAGAGWHPANGSPANQLASVTDGLQPNVGVAGLLNDNNPGNVINRFDYQLPGPRDVGQIRILGGNFGSDGRIFITTVVEASTNGGATFFPVGGFVPTLGANTLGYYQSDASGVVNAPGNPGNISGDAANPYEETLLTIFDDASATLIAGATDLRFSMYSVDNTGGQNRDPFNGVNSFTGVDDGLSAAFVSPLIWEIDVVAIPEPASCALAAAAVFGLVMIARRR
jgi:hypothetical protein